MNSNLKQLVIACLAIFALVISSTAYGMRCKGQLVHIGDTRGEVMSKCGSPNPYRSGAHAEGSGRYMWTKRGIRQHYAEYYVIERWTYNYGPRKFSYTLTFDNGELTDIKQQGYGY